MASSMNPVCIKRLKKELEDMNKTKDDNTVDPFNYSVGPFKGNIKHWKGVIYGPDDTPYSGGIFNIDIKIPDDYPYRPPVVTFLTKIYHCNINHRGGICLDILKPSSWSPALTISKVLISICSLLAEPNPSDPLVPSIARIYKKSKDKHDANAREWTIEYAGGGQI